MEAYVLQSCVFVQGFKHNGFDLLAEEVVTEFDLADSLVALEGVDNGHQTSIVQTARAQVKLLELCGAGAVACDHIGKDLQDLITQEVFVAYKCLQICLREHITQNLEAGRPDLIQTDV